MSTTIAIVDDVRLVEYAATTNYNDTLLTAGTYNGAAKRIRSVFAVVVPESSGYIATLRMYVSNGDANYANKTYRVHRVLRVPVETQATWNAWQTGSAWGAAGCSSTTTDYSTAAYADCTITGTGWAEWDISALLAGHEGETVWLSVRSLSEATLNSRCNWYSSDSTSEYKPEVVFVPLTPTAPTEAIVNAFQDEPGTTRVLYDGDLSIDEIAYVTNSANWSSSVSISAAVMLGTDTVVLTHDALTDGEIYAFTCNSDSGSYRFIDITASLVSDDHTSEGIVLTCANGDLLHIFRLAPGVAADHTDDTGYIASRRSEDDGATWGSNSVVYNDPGNTYDDRNIAAGVVPSGTYAGRIVVIFRRYDKTTSATIDSLLIYSDDHGATWEDPIDASALSGAQGILFAVPTVGLCLAGYASDASYRYGRIYVNANGDGITWDSGDTITTYQIAIASAYYPTESGYCYLGDGKLIGAFRTDPSPVPTRTVNLGVTLIKSNDYGATWTALALQSWPADDEGVQWVGMPHFSVWDDGSVYLLIGDRRGEQYTASAGRSRLWVYRATAADAYDYDFTLIGTALREYRDEGTDTNVFYGYPTAAKNSDGTYTVVFTDNYDDVLATEQADFFQFRLESSIPVAPTDLAYSAPNLTWADNSGTETGFHIYKDSVLYDSVAANVESYEVTEAGTYYVTAYNDAGESLPSNSVEVTLGVTHPIITTRPYSPIFHSRIVRGI